jgi:hypothetical protein
MLTGYDLHEEKARLGRWPTVREAILFLSARDEEAANKLRALGPKWMRRNIEVHGFGNIQCVAPDVEAEHRWPKEGEADASTPVPFVRVEACLRP